MDAKTSTTILILQRFKKGVLDLIDKLISILPPDEDLVGIRILISEQLPIKDVLEKYIKNVYLKYKEKMEKMDQDDTEFFLTYMFEFKSEKDKERCKKLRGYWINLDDGNKSDIMDYFRFYNKCCDKYLQYNQLDK